MSFSKPRLISRLWWMHFIFSKVQYMTQGIGELIQNTDIFLDTLEMRFYAGELHPMFYNDHRVVENLAKAIKGGVKFEVVFGPALHVGSANFLKLCRRDGVGLYGRSYRDPLHFKIIKRKDGTDIAILDRWHDVQRKPGSSIILLKGYEDGLAELERKFEAVAKTSKRIDYSRIIEEFSNRGTKLNGELFGFVKQTNSGIAVASDDEIDKLRRELEEK